MSDTLMQQLDKMRNDKLTIGKHKGRTYFEVYQNDKPYVSWVKSLDDPKFELAKFKTFVGFMTMIENSDGPHE